MKIYLTIAMVLVTSMILISANLFLSQIKLEFHTNSLINGLAKYQLFTFGVALLVLIVTILLNPESKQFLSIGQLHTVTSKEKWLGISGKSSWLKEGLHLGLFISLATFIFMFFGVKHTNSLTNFEWWFIPFVLLFSLTNSFTEEMIFRFALVGGLNEHYSKQTILLLSAILFGSPHYFGNPSGIIGVLMSGLLGYILCKATLETKGMTDKS